MGVQLVSLKVSVDGVEQTVTGIDRVNGSMGRMAAEAEKTSGRMGTSWQTMAKGVSLGLLIEKAIEKILEQLLRLKDYLDEAAKYAARVQTLGVVMEVVGNNAGYTDEQMKKFESQVKAMGITTEESRNSLVKMAAAEMDLSKASQLARVAQDAAVIGNLNSSEAFGRMIQGIRSGEVEILRTIGINVTFESGYKKLAESLGVTTAELTDQQKVLARQNQVLEYGKNIHGAYEAAMGTTGKQLNSMKRYYDEVKLAAGEAFSPALGALVEVTTNKLKALLEHFANNREAYQELAQNLGDIVRAAAHPIDAMTGMILSPWGSEEDDIEKREQAQRNAYFANLQRNLDERKRIQQGNAAREAQAAEERRRLAEKEAEEMEKYARQQENAYIKMYNQLQDKRRENNPYLDEEQKAVLKLRMEYDNHIATLDKALSTYQAHRAELERNYELDLKQLQVAQQLRKNMEEALALNKAELSEFAASSEASAEMDKKFWESIAATIKTIESMQPAAAFDQLIAQVGSFEDIARRFPDMAEQVSKAIAKLKEDFANSSGLNSLLQQNQELQTSMIADPFERQKAQIADRYNFEREQAEKALSLAEKDADKRAAIQKHLTLLQAKYMQDTSAVENESFRSRLGMAAQYVGMVGQAFQLLADTQDQTSREGFEKAKEYALAAAVVNTAAAVVNALATVQPWPAAIAAAALAAAAGAAQIAKIQSTEFGGGNAGVAAFSAGFAAGGGSLGGSAGVGSRIGAPIVSIHDSQTDGSLQRLAASADNASLAIGRVADGMTKISDMFAEGSMAQNALKATPNWLTKVSTADNTISWGSQMWNNILGASGMGFLGLLMGKKYDTQTAVSQIAGTLTGGMNWIIQGMFGIGNKWYTSGAGIELGIQAGKAMGRSFLQETKDGGWISSKEERTTYSDINTGFMSFVEQQVEIIKSTLSRAAIVMGTSTDFTSVEIPYARISTANRSQEDIQKDVEAFFTRIADILGQTMEGLSYYSYVGESAFDASVRLATALQSVNEKFDLMHFSLIETSLAGANAAYRLQDLMGGAEKFAGTMDNYFKTMFSESQQKEMLAAAARKKVESGFAEINDYIENTINAAYNNVTRIIAETALRNGESIESVTVRANQYLGYSTLPHMATMAIPKTKEEFNALVESLDKATPAGQQLYKALMDLYEAFATMTNQAEEASKKLATTFLDNALNAAGTMQDILTGPLSGKNAFEQYRQTSEAYAAAKASGADLSDLGKRLLEASQTIFASSTRYFQDRNMVLEDLRVQSGMQAEVTLSNVEKQISVLEEIKQAYDDGTAQIVDSISQLRDAIWTKWVSDYNSSALASLPALASGGITSGISIAGEGSYPEAVVPLPDGRTIPVRMTGSSDGGASAAEIRELRAELSDMKKQVTQLLSAQLGAQQEGFTRVDTNTRRTAEATEEIERIQRREAA